MFRNFIRKIFYFLRDIFYNPILNQKFNFYFRNKKNYIFFTERIDKKNNYLTDLANRFGSDKGGEINKNICKRKILNNYTPLYEKLFSKNRLNLKLFFEVGVGTNNEDVPSNMGRNGIPGASLFMWQEYFPNAEIYGADIDKRILFNKDRIKTFHVDQYSSESIKNMWKEINKNNFDVILDDGIHDYKGNINFFENSFEFLKTGGIYIIEDVDNIYVNKFREYFQNSNFEVEMIDYFHKTHHNIEYNKRVIVIYKN